MEIPSVLVKLHHYREALLTSYKFRQPFRITALFMPFCLCKRIIVFTKKASKRLEKTNSKRLVFYPINSVVLGLRVPRLVTFHSHIMSQRIFYSIECLDYCMFQYIYYVHKKFVAINLATPVCGKTYLMLLVIFRFA